jgi:hypothetical protein
MVSDILNVKCRYAECRHAECGGTISMRHSPRLHLSKANPIKHDIFCR